MTENFPILLKEPHPGPRSTESPTQSKPKEKHAKTYTNQTKKNLAKRENIGDFNTPLIPLHRSSTKNMNVET